MLLGARLTGSLSSVCPCRESADAKRSSNARQCRRTASRESLQVTTRPSNTAATACLQVRLVRVDAVALPAAGLAEYADPFQHIGGLLDARQIELRPTLPVAVGALGGEPVVVPALVALERVA